jgi:hypothetical protein
VNVARLARGVRILDAGFPMRKYSPTKNKSKKSSSVDASWRGEKDSDLSSHVFMGDTIHGTGASAGDFSG